MGGTVSIGETSYTIAKFRGFKAEVAGDVVSRVTQEAQQVIASWNQFTREWHEQNKLRITRDVCSERIASFREAAATAANLAEKAPQEAEEVEDGETRPKTGAELQTEQRLFEARAESWEQQLKDLGDKPFVEVPDPEGPPLGEQVMHVFPEAFRLARDEVKQLMALVVISNGDLQQADENGNVQETLSALGKKLFYEGEIGELMELCVAAAETLEEEWSHYRNTVGKLQALYDRAFNRDKAKKSQPESETSTSDSPTSSTSSEELTAGPEEKPSSESPTESSSASVAA